MSVARTYRIMYVTSLYNKNHEIEIINVTKSVHHGAVIKL